MWTQLWLVNGGDYLTVMFSFLVAVFSAYVAFEYLEGIRTELWKPYRWTNRRQVPAVLTMALGLWAMHFIAALTIHWPLEVRYHLIWLVTTFFLGVLCTGLSFVQLLRKPFGIASLLGSSLLMSAGIALVHFMGMASMVWVGNISYDWWRMFISVLFAFLCALGAYWVFQQHRRWGELREGALRRLGSSFLLGIGIIGMHHLAISGTSLYLVSDLQHEAVWMVDHDQVMWLIGIAMLVITGFSLMAAHIDKQSAYYAKLEMLANERFRALIQHVSDLVMVIDQKGLITFASPSLARVLGFPLKETTGRNWWDLLGTDEEQARLLMERAWGSPGVCLQEEIRVKDASGSSRFLELTVKNMLSDPAIKGVVLNAHDVTRFKQIQHLMIDRGRLLEIIVQEHSLEAIMEQLSKTIEAHFDNTCCAVLLLDEDKQLHHLAAPSLPAEYIKAIDGLPIGPLAGTCGAAAYYKKSIYLPNVQADPLWKDYRGIAKRFGIKGCYSVPIMSTTGQVLGTLAIYFDDEPQPNEELFAYLNTFAQLAGIAIERKRAEQALMRKEEQYRLLFESNPNPMWVFDTETFRFLAVNKAALRHYGYTREEFMGMSLMDIRPSDEVERFLTITRFWDDHNPSVKQEGIWRHIKKTGETIYVEIRTQAILFGGRPARVALINDVTERLEAEQKLREAKEMAEKASTIKSEFLARMSHEIRTPLHVVSSIADLLEDTGLTQEQRKYLEVCRKAGSTLLQLVNDILDLSKIEADHLVFDETEFDLEKLVQDTVEVFSVAAADKQIELLIHFSEAARTTVSGDRNRLQQVLMNLIGNAVKYTERGKVEIRVTRQPDSGADRFLFTISDTGIGIAAEKWGSIFESFAQADQRISERYGGTGLGLSIAKKIVERMGGKIWLTSMEHVGSTFFIEIPMRGGKSSPAIVQQESMDTGKPLRILLADDSEDNQLLIRTFLKNTPHTIEVAGNGLMALEKFRSATFDVVLMDMQMPVMDGYTAVRMIRQWEKEWGVPEVPIVAITAFALTDVKERCLQAGCSGFVTKPISKEGILRVIYEFADKKHEMDLPDELTELLPIFVENRKHELERLPHLLATEQYPEIQQIGHRMKGYGGGYGFPKLTEIGEKMEQAALRKEKGGITRCIWELADAVAHMEEQVRRIQEKQGRPV